MRPAAFALYLLASTGSCASAPPRPTREQACRGTAIHLDQVASICAVPSAKSPLPPQDGLEAEIRPLPLYVQAGEVLHARVRLTNVTSSPLELDVALGSESFQAIPRRDDGTAANLDDSDSARAAPTASAPIAHVTLDPSGWVEKELAFTATRARLDCPQPKQPCQERLVGAMEPGTYRLEVVLPFPDAPAAPATPEALRTVEAQLVVTPPPA